MYKVEITYMNNKKTIYITSKPGEAFVLNKRTFVRSVIVSKIKGE